MSQIATVDSLWRYPVKSMCGEELSEAFVGFAGIYGDRCFAFQSSAAVKGFPYLTAREQRAMLQYRPRFRDVGQASRPVNLTEAQSLGPGVTPVFGDRAGMMVDVETPTGATLAVDDPALQRLLREGVSDAPELTLVYSERSLTDCRPLSLLATQSVKQLGEEIGDPVDPRCFRANIYLNFQDHGGFAEDELVGKSLRIGEKAVITILERDPRCVMITLDPDTSKSRPEVLKQVAQLHEGNIGVYAAVLVEGMIHKGDAVELM